jgi:hypothetical protein
LETGLDRPRQRVRYWAALSLLRCLMSSPAAAVQAFSKRTEAVRPRTEDSEDDEQRQRETMDALREEGTLDTVPEAAIEAGEVDLSERDRRRLREFGRRAEAIVEAQEDPRSRRRLKSWPTFCGAASGPSCTAGLLQPPSTWLRNWNCD